jgi:hypothetical protein
MQHDAAEQQQQQQKPAEAGPRRGDGVMTAGDSFAADITARARWALEHNHKEPKAAWSTGEKLAVALVLGNRPYLDAAGYTPQEAASRLSGDLMGADIGAWLSGVRAALADLESQAGS